MNLSTQSSMYFRSKRDFLSQRIDEVSARMYEILFSYYPELKSLFINIEDQKINFAKLMLTTLEMHDEKEKINGIIEKLAIVHKEHNVREQYYEIFGDSLIQALSEVLGENHFNPNVCNHWLELYIELKCMLTAQCQH